MSIRYIVYIRKSSEREERQSLSIPAQHHMLNEQYGKLNIVKVFRESKSAFYPGREDFEAMMRMLKDSEADGIISWHPDRLSRNEVDAAQITYGLRTGLIKDLKFGSYFFDNSPEGIMMLQNIMSNSQYFSSKLSKDVKRGNGEHFNMGWLNGRANEGYLNKRSSNDGTKDYGVVIKDPFRFPLRRQMWDLMLTGEYSIPQIAGIANNQWGYMTRGNRKHPSGPLPRTSLYSMFNNPRYAGKIPVPGKPNEYTKSSYPPMVTEEEYNRVQGLLGDKGTRKLTAKRTFIFRGALACGECGCMITAEEKTKRSKNDSVKYYIYYHCTHKRTCSQRKNVREESLNKQFVDFISKYTILPQFKDWALEALEEQNEIETTDIGEVLKSQNRNVESAHKEMKGLIKMGSKELISEEQFVQEKKELDARIAQIEEEREDTKKRAESWYATAIKTFELAVHGRERFIKGDIQIKKEILADIGSNPVLLDGKLQIIPHPYLEPIEKEYKELEEKYLKVRTLPQQMKKDAIASVRSEWLGRQGSNLRMTVPKTVALPLGDAPLLALLT